MIWYTFYYLVVSTRFFEVRVNYKIFTTLTDQHHHVSCPTKTNIANLKNTVTRVIPRGHFLPYLEVTQPEKKGSLNHPKMVTKNCQERMVSLKKHIFRQWNTAAACRKHHRKRIAKISIVPRRIDLAATESSPSQTRETNLIEAKA